MQPRRTSKQPRRLLQALIQLAEKTTRHDHGLHVQIFPAREDMQRSKRCDCFRSLPVVNVIQWAEDTEENSIFARAASREITDMVVTGNVDFAEADNIGHGNDAGALPTRLVEMLVLLTLWPDPEVSVGLTDGGPVNDTTIRGCKH